MSDSGGAAQSGWSGGPPGEAPDAGTSDPYRLAGTEVLDSGGAILPPPRRGRRRTVFAGVAVGIGVIGVAAGAYAYSAIGGGGDRPEQHLPAGVAGLIKVDLDPSLSQKVDALQFASKFPDSKDLNWDSADKDPRKWLYENLTKDSTNAPPWSEVNAWLGKRAGVAVLPAESKAAQPIPLLAIQVTDVTKATASLRKASTSGDNLGVAAADGWLLVSDTQAHADSALAKAKTSPLSDNASFAADVDAVGDQGIATIWFDYAALRALGENMAALNAVNPSALDGFGDLTGHGALALRFSGANLEMAGNFRDLSGDLMSGSTPAAVELPTDSLAAVSIGGLGDQLAAQWPKLIKSLATSQKVSEAELVAEFEKQSGLKLPQDLQALLGQQFSFALDRKSAFGLRVKSSATGLDATVAKVVQQLGNSTTLSHKSIPGGYVLASSEQAADALAKGGDLASSERFKNAVPGASGAASVVYVDIAGIVDVFGKDLSAKDRAGIAPLDAVGMSSTRTSDTSASFTMRLITK